MPKLAFPGKSLQDINPSLAAEWHPTRNGRLSPTDVPLMSNKKVWWQCKRGHEWATPVYRRSNGGGCPFCSGKAVCEDNCLSTVNPKLSAEWHPVKNNKLTPKDIMPGSRIKAWWLCQKGHEWQAVIYSRSVGRGCPFCSGKAVCEDNCLSTVNPSLAAEWHPIRNGDLTPKDVTPSSGKKAWWLCKNGHEWQTTIHVRNSQGSGCPYCSGNLACEDNCLSAVNPELIAEWHLINNGNLTPKDFTPGSEKKIWWQCKRGHVWQAAINHRSRGQGCPYCAGKATSEDNCLDTLNPTLAAEWHPTRNGSLTPKDVVPGSLKKAWWQCKRGHEWKTSISHRSEGTGCPYCHSATSQIELALFCEMKCLFKNVKHRSKEYGQECDVYLPEFKIGFEIDALYWHKDKYERDKRKYDLLTAQGITVLNVREKGLKKISNNDVFYSPKESLFITISNIISRLPNLAKLSESQIETCRTYMNRGELVNRQEFTELLYMLPSPMLEASLQVKNFAWVAQWHPTKNGSLTPKDVTPKSNKKVWWMCEKGHEWEAPVNNRNKGSGCPYCAGYFASMEYCLESANPNLAAEWHPTRNGSSTPKDVVPGSSKKVWWLCKKGHKYQTTIHARIRGGGCPYCYGRYATAEKCLSSVNPSLAGEWHPTRNGSSTPKDVTPSSGKKAWWLCQKGHEWEAMIANRNKGRGCPYCAGQLASRENCLEVLNPGLAAEWHPTKNGSLTPKDVTSMSGKKVWWQCKNGHEWEATIASRSLGRGCPYCSGRNQ